MDLRLHISFFLNYGESFDEKDGFFKGFFCDFSFDILYVINPAIDIRIIFNFNNANIDGALHNVFKRNHNPSNLDIFSSYHIKARTTICF